MNLYRIFYLDNNDRDELGRVSASNIEEATEYAIKQYLNQEIDRDTLINQIDGDDKVSYVMLNACLNCEYYNLSDKDKQIKFRELNGEKIKLSEIDTICEYCENSTEYLEVLENNEFEPEFKTIYGVNEYANLETDQRPKPYNETLVKAWNIDPNKGVTELMYQTINNNPDLINGISLDYLKEINKNHKELIDQ